MRQKPVNEAAVEKTINFLSDLKLYCAGKINVKNITKLHELHQVSRSTASACKKLEIVKQTETGMVWMANEPNRQMALMVLNLNLERSPNVMKAQQLDGFADFTTSIKALTDAMNIVATQNERVSRGLKISSNQTGETLFSKDQQYFDLVKSIAMGLYANPATDLVPYQNINQMAVDAAKDLMNKAFQ